MLERETENADSSIVTYSSHSNTQPEIHNCMQPNKYVYLCKRKIPYWIVNTSLNLIRCLPTTCF